MNETERIGEGELDDSEVKGQKGEKHSVAPRRASYAAPLPHLYEIHPTAYVACARQRRSRTCARL